MAFYHSILLSNTSFICILCQFFQFLEWFYLVFEFQISISMITILFLLLFLEKSDRKYSLSMDQERDPFLRIFSLFLNLHARWKGTGEPCSKFFSKFLKNFPGHFWKILCFLKSLYSPLSYGIWILVRHPLVETLAFSEHSVVHSFFKIKIFCSPLDFQKFLDARSRI